MTYRLIFWCPIFFLKFDMITIRSHDYMYINIELEEANYVSEQQSLFAYGRIPYNIIIKYRDFHLCFDRSNKKPPSHLVNSICNLTCVCGCLDCVSLLARFV